jgi:hypothetical protein
LKHGTLVLAVVLVAVAVVVASSSAAVPDPTLGGCQVFPNPPAGTPGNAKSLPTQAAWNQDISKAPRDPRSNSYISYIDSHGEGKIHPDFGSPASFGIPYSVVGPDEPKLPTTYTEAPEESDPGPFPIPGATAIEGGTDNHAIAVETGSCTLYELFNATYKPSPPSWVAGSGARWDLNSDALRPESFTSADAAGLPIFAGLVRYDEVASGVVEHAIRVTFDSTRNAWVNPAVHCAGDTAKAVAPPMGLRFRLKASYGLGKFSGAAKVIAIALKRYGMINADNGSNWFISGSPDPRWNDGNLNQLKRIPGSAFEVVKSAAKIHVC